MKTTRTLRIHVIGTFFAPARMALVPRTVPASGLLGANSLGQLTKMVAGVLGAAITGLIAGTAGVVWPVLVVDAATFLLSALLVPFSEFLQRHRWPKWLAVTVAMLATLAAVAGLLTLGISQIVRGSGDLARQTVVAWEEFRAWLLDGPLADLRIAGFWSAILLAALAVGSIGALIEWLVLRRIYRAPELFQLLANLPGGIGARCWPAVAALLADEAGDVAQTSESRHSAHAIAKALADAVAVERAAS